MQCAGEIGVACCLRNWTERSQSPGQGGDVVVCKRAAVGPKAG